MQVSNFSRQRAQQAQGNSNLLPHTCAVLAGKRNHSSWDLIPWARINLDTSVSVDPNKRQQTELKQWNDHVRHSILAGQDTCPTIIVRQWRFFTLFPHSRPFCVFAVSPHWPAPASHFRSSWTDPSRPAAEQRLPKHSEFHRSITPLHLQKSESNPIKAIEKRDLHHFRPSWRQKSVTSHLQNLVKQKETKTK